MLNDCTKQTQRNSPVQVDYILNLEVGPTGDVIGLTGVLYRFQVPSEVSDPFAAGIFCLSADEDDTLLEADIPGQVFSTILVLDIAPALFTATNFRTFQ